MNARYKKIMIARKQFWKKKENGVNDKSVDVFKTKNKKFVNL